MKPIGTPAWKLTADCIWNSFQSSGKEGLALIGGQEEERLKLLQALARKAGPMKFCPEGEDVFRVRLDAPFGQLGCVIMGSGLGRRFGGNKLLARLDGKPLIQYALDATAGIFARRVVVTRHQAVAALCKAQGVPVLLHTEPYRSDTVRLGLEALTGQPALDGVLFCPGDQPLLKRETVGSLALCGASVPGTIWRAAWQGTPGAPVLFPAWAFEELRHLPQGKGGGVVIRHHPDQVRLVSASSRWELADVDCPENLEEMEALLASRDL